MTEPHEEPLVASLEGRAEARRRDGTYPPDIDASLQADVDRRIRDASTHTSALRAAVAQLHDLGGFELPSYRGSNKVKALYATVVDKLLGFALADIVRQLERHRVALDRVLEVVVEEAEATGATARDDGA